VNSVWSCLPIWVKYGLLARAMSASRCSGQPRLPMQTRSRSWFHLITTRWILKIFLRALAGSMSSLGSDAHQGHFRVGCSNSCVSFQFTLTWYCFCRFAVALPLKTSFLSVRHVSVARRLLSNLKSSSNCWMLPSLLEHQTRWWDRHDPRQGHFATIEAYGGTHEWRWHRLSIVVQKAFVTNLLEDELDDWIYCERIHRAHRSYLNAWIQRIRSQDMKLVIGQKIGLFSTAVWVETPSRHTLDLILIHSC